MIRHRPTCSQRSSGSRLAPPGKANTPGKVFYLAETVQKIASSTKRKDFKSTASLSSHPLRLQKALVQLEEKERVLVRCQLELQHSIRCKADYLYIDEVVCGQHREAVTACRY